MPNAMPKSRRAMILAALKRQSTEQHAALRAAAEKAPVPWDAELIKSVAFQVWPNDFKIYTVHPGFDLQKPIEAVATTREAFCRAVDDLLRIPEELAGADAVRFDHIEAAVQDITFSAAEKSAALVNHSTRLNKKVPIADYKTRIGMFVKDPQHNFIKCLRNSLHHSHIVHAMCQGTTHRDAPDSFTVILDKDEILHAVSTDPRDSWNSPAKQYIEAHGRTIDLLPLFENYRDRIDELHTWWQAEIEANAPPELTDFRGVKDMIKRVRKIQALKALLPNLIAKDVDPYAHWRDHLPSEQLEELETMPRNSAQQVNRLIDIADCGAWPL